MDEVLISGAVALAVVLLFNIITANAFEKIAVEKGYSGYFWWCFFLGLAGWIMVAALPYKRANQPALKDDGLARLSTLHDKGAISDEEYESMKSKLQHRA